MILASWRGWGLVAAAVTFSCHSPTHLASHASTSPLVASGDGVAITVDEVAELAKSRHVSPREALEVALSFELLAAEAARQGVVLDDDDRVRLRQVLVQRFLAEAIEPQLDPSRIKEADVRALYEKGRGQFVHPRLVKVAMLAVFTGARMKPVARARQEETARAMAAAVQSAASDRSAELFGKIGHDPTWVERQVSYGEIWQAADGDHPYPLPFGRAVAALHHPGETTALVCEESGCYLARYIGERAAENVPFEAVADMLRGQMAAPWRQHRFSELVAAFAGPHDIAAEPGLLKDLKIDTEGF